MRRLLPKGRSTRAGRAALAPRSARVLGLVALLLMAQARTAWAARDFGGVYPMIRTDVSLLSADVAIGFLQPFPDVAPGIYAEARCEFRFRNDSLSAETVTMTFPAECPEDELGLAGDRTIHAFRPLVDGEEVPVGLAGAFPVPDGAPGFYTKWFTFAVSFAPGQERRVITTYWLRNYSSAEGEARLRYDVRALRPWNGPVGRLTVTLNLGDVGPHQVVAAFPNNWRFTPDGRSLVWERAGFEPAGDFLWVALEWKLWLPGYLTNIGEEGRAGAERRRDSFLDLVARGPALGADQLVALYREVAATLPTEPEVWGKLAYIRSLIPEDVLPWAAPVVTSVSVLSGDEVVLGESCWVDVAFRDDDADAATVAVAAFREGSRARGGSGGDGPPAAAATLSETLEHVAFSDKWCGQLTLDAAGLYRVEVAVEDGGGRVGAAVAWYDTRTGVCSVTRPATRASWVGLAAMVGAAVIVVAAILSVSRRVAARARAAPRTSCRSGNTGSSPPWAGRPGGRGSGCKDS